MIDITNIKYVTVTRLEYIMPILSEYTHNIEDPNLLLKILKNSFNDIEDSSYYNSNNIFEFNVLEVTLKSGIINYLKFDESFLPLRKSIRSYRIKKIK